MEENAMDKYSPENLKSVKSNWLTGEVTRLSRVIEENRGSCSVYTYSAQLNAVTTELKRRELL